MVWHADAVLPEEAGRRGMSGVVTVRIFLASPSADTMEARGCVVQVVGEINADPQYAPHVRLDLRCWDDPAQPVVCDRKGNPQQDIAQQIGSPGDCALVIGIFAHTMGGHLPRDRFPVPDGRDGAWHCSEWEVAQGLAADRSVWVFHDQRPLLTNTAQAKRASLAVSEYIEHFDLMDGAMLSGFNPFADLDDLAAKLRHGLRVWLKRHFVTVVDAGPNEPERPDLRPYLIRRRDHWRSTDAGQLDQRFVNLSLMIDHGLTHDGPRHTQEARFDRLSDLLAKRHDVGAWVLVGDPGAGKSTILQHHEMMAAAAALADDAGALPELCVWQRLSTYSHDSPPPAEWLAQHWPADLPALAALRGAARVRLLLDGLNEIKAPDRARQLEAIDRWTEWAAWLAHQGDHLLAPIFSVRTLDQSPLSTGDFEVRQIVVGRWSDAQIRLYCQQMLGDQGEALWRAIKGDSHLLELSSLPFNLRAQCELFRELGAVVRDRARLMGGIFWLRLRNQARTAPLKVPGLIGEDDVRLLSGDRWKSLLAESPEKLPEEGCLVPWLDDRAQALQRLGRQVSVSKRELLQGLPSHDPSCAPADWLKAVGALQLIDEGSGEQTALRRFSHQLWQEFFAARCLRDLPTHAPDRLPDLRPPALAPLDEVLAKLGVQEPLPGPDPSHWEEPVKLAVQLVGDPLAWVRALEAVNLPLAGRAAVACQEKAEALHGAAVFDGLRQALLARSRDAKVDVRLRIEAGLVLGDLGDPRYERRTGPHGEYLWPKSEHWVHVPGGSYTIGRNGQGDEGPETLVSLEPFEIAFAPVTNAEFRCFVDAGGYDPQALWWDSDVARDWLAGEDGSVDAGVQEYLSMLDSLRAQPARFVCNLPPGYRPQILRHLAISAAEVLAEVTNQRSQLPRDRPGFFQDIRFNQASQPVVGLCLFEARAYSQWLAAQSGCEVWIPTEAEWEVAAAGDTARRHWPHGDIEPKFDQINYDQTRLWRTSPVGVFPRGEMKSDSSGGVTDMAGNVWEWTSSSYLERHDADSIATTGPDESVKRVVRGGSWNDPAEMCRTYSRLKSFSGNRDSFVGLRLVRWRVPHSES